MSRKHQKAYANLNYIEHFLILASAITGSVSAFTSLLGIPITITFCSAIGLKICAIIVGIKKYNSIIKKKENDKIVSLAKSKLNKMEVLISKALVDSSISHDEFILINNVLKEYDEMKDEINNLKT